MSNFPEVKQTAETALLFLQLIMRRLRRPVGGSKGGRCGMVVPNGVLFGDGVCARIKEELLKEFNLHTIVRLPNGVFAPYTSIPTNLLFFDRSGQTKEIWYYEQPLPEGRKTYTKTQWSGSTKAPEALSIAHPLMQFFNGARRTLVASGKSWQGAIVPQNLPFAHQTPTWKRRIGAETSVWRPQLA